MNPPGRFSKTARASYSHAKKEFPGLIQSKTKFHWVFKNQSDVHVKDKKTLVTYLYLYFLYNHVHHSPKHNMTYRKVKLKYSDINVSKTLYKRIKKSATSGPDSIPRKGEHRFHHTHSIKQKRRKRTTRKKKNKTTRKGKTKKKKKTTRKSKTKRKGKTKKRHK